MSALPVLLNHRAGSTDDGSGDAIAKAMEGAGVDARIEPTPPEDIQARVAALRAEGVPIVAVAGGDGTLRSAAQMLAGGDTALAPLAFGRRNHFARRLGLDDADATARAVADPTILDVALGTAGEEVFLDTAVLGAYAHIVEVRERLRPFLGTWGGTLVAWSAAWARWPSRELTLRTSEGVLSCHVPLVWAGTGAHAFPAPHHIEPADHTDRLEVVLPPPGRRLGALKAMPALFHRRGEKRFRHLERALDMQRVRWVEVEDDGGGPLPATLDGEPMELPGPVRLALGRATLKVVVGREG